MKTLRPLAWLVWIAVFSAVSSAQEESAPPTQTLAPFFFIQTDDPNLDPLPLKSISAAVRISGVIADVTIEQVYMNEGESPLEATYIFPASTGAAVYGMKMTIGQRSITAEIREREEARQEYEEARDEGKSASLLEQQRPNVFQMHVANLLPGDTIQVQLKYTELLVPTEGIYEFIYPTVVGPRYSSTPLAETESRDLFVATPYLHEGKSAPYDFDITVDLTAGLPIQELVSTSHQVDINFADTDRAGIRLSASEESPGNRDFILRYKLRGERIAAGLLLYQGEQENFFLFMGQPPERVDTAAIPPREYIFIVDVSGSMRGFPLTVSKALLRDLISSLQPTDTFNVLLFAGTSVLMSPESVAATADNINWAIDVIDNQSGGGGTRILSAMGRALQLPRPTAETARTIVIVTDGYVHVEAEAFQLIRDNLHDANLFAFGIGSSVNRFIIEGMARAGMGEPFVVTREGEAQEKAAQFREYIRTPVLSQVEFDAGGLDIYDVEPVSIPDILAERPVIVFGKWRGEPEGTMSLTGKTGLGDYTTQI
ncbi:MAG: VWA domain-containing protein, partial [Gemmatimonadetes bacterium]|nr:VWA domain-containing protein [Gemmatimonadota bacterium]